MNITIIIPTYNRAKILQTTLNSFLLLQYEKIKWEIIVVDNNSKDDTKDIVLNFNNILPIRYLFEKKQGKNYALNTAVKQSKGAVLVFIDDDILVDRLWLIEIYSSTLRYPDYDVFGGKTLPQFPRGTPEWIKKSNYSIFVYGIHDLDQQEGEYQNSGTPGGANCWVRGQVFRSGNMYSVDIGPKGYGRISGSELEFFTRLLRKGIKPVYIPTALVTHRIQKFQTKKKYLVKRSYASGRGFIYVHNDSISPRIFGVPRYIFRQIVEGLIKSIYCYIKLDIKSAFEHVMYVAHRVGCVKQYWLNFGK